MTTTMRRLDPRLADLREMEAGLALRQVGAPKRVAAAVGVGIRTAQAWCAGEKPSPVSRCGDLLEALTQAGLSPFAVLNYLESRCVGAMMQMSDEALARRFFELLEEEETAREHPLNKLQQTFMKHGDLRAVERGAAEHGAALAELRFIARELRRRKVDPRMYHPFVRSMGRRA